MNSQEIMNKLQDPFQACEIEWRVGSTNKDKSKGLALAYVTNRAIQNRLDDVFGVFGWQNEFKEWKGNSQICGISVWYEDRNQWITKWDGADDSQTEAVKGGLSDSMKRAAYQWGIGRYLYELPQTWVPLKDGKYIIQNPSLPSWAIPKGDTSKADTIVPPDSSQGKQNPPPSTQRPQSGASSQPLTAIVTEAQIKRLFAISRAHACPDHVIKTEIEKLGKSSSKELNKAEYDKICAFAENYVITQADADWDDLSGFVMPE